MHPVRGDFATEVKRLCPEIGVPVTTPITAAFAALSAFSAKRIGLLTPYIEEVNAPIRKLFYERGIEVVAL